MKYLLFRHDLSHRPYNGEIPYKIESIKATIFQAIRKKVTFQDFIWNLISLNNCELYVCRNEKGEIIHRSRVVGKNIKYSFLGKNDIEIGPCYTEETYRGQGIYPAVISRILTDKNQTAYMLVRENNISSIKGIKKAGFRQMGYVRKTNTGRWVNE